MTKKAIRSARLLRDASQYTRDFLLIGLGVIVAGFGLKGFLLPNGFIDGGITGISLLLQHLTQLPLSYFIILLNLPFVWLGSQQISWIFSFKTLTGILGLSLCLYWINIHTITDDKLLIAVFGGLLLGAGIGLCIRGGGVIDGTEVLAVYLNKKTHLSIGDIILIVNIIIFTVAAFLLGLEQALYSVLTYIAASKTIDFIIQGIEEYIGITIISYKNKLIKNKLIHELSRGVTIYKGETGYGTKGEGNQEIDIIFTVVTRLQINKIKNEINKIDPNAFIVETPVYDIKGGMIKRRAFKS